MGPRRRLALANMGGLRMFEAAARLGSFKAAAEELHVTPAAVSHQIRSLEDALRAKVFERLNRQVRLTPAGRTLAAAAGKAFDLLDGALEDLARDGMSSGPARMTVSCAPSLAAKWLAPRLQRFAAAHPRFDVRLVASEALVDLRREVEFDLALRYGPPPSTPGLHIEALWPAGEIIAVCAPGVLDDSPSTLPKTLGQRTLLRTAPPPPSATETAVAERIGWLEWLAAAGALTPETRTAAERGPLFSSTHLALEAAISGQGLALAPAILVSDDLRTGRLVRASPVKLTDPFSFWLLTQPDRLAEPRVRAFTNWLRSEAASSP